MERTNQNKLQNKKSFILYLNQLNILDDLTNDEAGKLFKIIANFVHTGEDLPMDKLIKIAYLPIKQSLKRDLESWRNKLQTNRDNGKLGGRPKKNNKPNHNPINPSGYLDNPINPVNENVNVNVNVNEELITLSQYISITKEQEKILHRKYLFSEHGKKLINKAISFLDSKIKKKEHNENESLFEQLIGWVFSYVIKQPGNNYIYGQYMKELKHVITVPEIKLKDDEPTDEELEKELREQADNGNQYALKYFNKKSGDIND